MKIHLECKFTADDAGAVTGLAWPFNTVDRVGDVIEKGAFAGARAPLPMLWSHDPQAVIGQWSGIVETDRGLEVRGSLNLAVPKAAEVHSLLQRGDVTGLSIGFRTLKSKPRQGGGRSISALDLAEISIVAIPANPAAKVESVKSARSASASSGENTMDPEDIAAAVAALEKKLAELEPQSTKVASLEAELTNLRKKSAELETRLNRPGAGGADEAKARDEAKRKAFGAYLRHADRAPADELKTLTVSSDPQGGYLAPGEISNEFIRNLVEFSPIRALASVRTTGSPSVSYPKRTSVTNAKWKGEGQAQEGSEPAFGQVEIPVREVNTYVDVSNQLLADSAGQAEAEVRLALAEDFGQKEGLAFVKGAGTLDPQGLMTHPDIGYIPTGTTSGLNATAPADDLISLMYSLPAAYRARGTWLMNSRTLAVIRKIKAIEGLYIWQPALAAGQPEVILGRPVVEIPDMDDLGANKEAILFGDIATAYRIVDRISLSVLVNPYVLASQGITRIHATRRVGGGVIQPAAIKKLRCSAS